MAGCWVTLFMKLNNYCVCKCEYDAITQAAITERDGLDGVVDGIVTDLTKCTFDLKILVVKTTNCTSTGTTVKISTAAAEIAQEVWEGAKGFDNSSLWFGLNKDASLTTFLSFSETECSSNSTCAADPWTPTADWIRLFVLKDPDADLSHITRRDLTTLPVFHCNNMLRLWRRMMRIWENSEIVVGK